MGHHSHLVVKDEEGLEVVVWSGQVSYSSAALHFAKYILFMQISSSGNLQKLTSVIDTSGCKTITESKTPPYIGTQNFVQHICTADFFPFLFLCVKSSVLTEHLLLSWALIPLIYPFIHEWKHP